MDSKVLMRVCGDQLLNGAGLNSMSQWIQSLCGYFLIPGYGLGIKKWQNCHIVQELPLFISM